MRLRMKKLSVSVIERPITDLGRKSADNCNFKGLNKRDFIFYYLLHIDMQT